MIKCRNCQTELFLGNNWKHRYSRGRLCCHCYYILRKEYMKKYKESPSYKTWKKNYSRNHALIIEGKYFTINKREFQGFCELCKEEIQSHPQWHHWNDNYPEMGMWLCLKCHDLAEIYEQYHSRQSEIKEYLLLKERIKNGTRL